MKDEKTININLYINVVRKKIIFILIFTLITTGLAYVYSFRIAKPLYTTTTTVIIGKDTNINTDRLNQGDVQMYQSLIKTYTQIVQSKLVATRAAELLNTGVTAEILMNNMSVSSVLNSQVISITYTGGSSKVAAERSNALAMAFVYESQVLLPSGMARIMDKADENDAVSKLNKARDVVLASFLGMMLSIGLAFLLNFLDNRIKSEEDVDKYLNIPMVGIIPMENKIGRVIVYKDSKSPVTEAFKSIRTNLLFSLKSRDIRTLLVSSSLPNEGKSTISSNIAAAISQTGKTVLIIDCDLRRPSIHRAFDLSNEKGLVDLIFDEVNLEDVVVKIHENLFVLPSGKIPFNPSELLYTPKMKKFIKDMEVKYDYVILDTPPIIVFTDTLTLVDEKIAVILVVDSSQTKIEVCKKAKHLLQNVNATLIGTILNKVNKNSIEGYGYDYYSYGKGKKRGKSKKN